MILFRLTKNKEFTLDDKWMKMGTRDCSFFMPKYILFVEAWKEYLCNANSLDYMYLHTCSINFKSSKLNEHFRNKSMFFFDVSIPINRINKVQSLKAIKVFKNIPIKHNTSSYLKLPSENDVVKITAFWNKKNSVGINQFLYRLFKSQMNERENKQKNRDSIREMASNIAASLIPPQIKKIPFSEAIIRSIVGFLTDMIMDMIMGGMSSISESRLHRIMANKAHRY